MVRSGDGLHKKRFWLRVKKGLLKISMWKCPDDKPTMSAGTGDRMWGILSSFVIAAITQQVFFISCPSEPYSSSHVVAPAAIDWRVTKHVLNDTSGCGILVDLQFLWMTCTCCPRWYRCQYVLTPRRLHQRINVENTIPKLFSVHK